jgi:hypothetical protein
MGKTYRAIVEEAYEAANAVMRGPQEEYELTFQCEPCWQKWDETSPSQMGSSTCPRCKKQLYPVAVELA